MTALYHGNTEAVGSHLLRKGFRAPAAPFVTWLTSDLDRAFGFAGLHGAVVQVDTDGLPWRVLPAGIDWHPEELEAATRQAIEDGVVLLGIEDSSNVTLLPGWAIEPDRVQPAAPKQVEECPKTDTLRMLLQQVDKRKFERWLREEFEDKEDRQQILGHELSLLDALEQYLDGQCAVQVRDDGLVNFYSLYRDRSCDVARTIGDLPVVLYHHTASGAIPGIIEHGGLVRGLDLGYKATKRDSGRYVYLTTELAGPAVDGYVARAVQRYGGHSIMLEVVTTLSDVDPDPDDADISTGRTQFVMPFVPLSAIIGGVEER